MTVVALEPSASVDRDEVLALYESVGWSAYTKDVETLLRALAGSSRLATARNDGGSSASPAS